MLVHPYALYGLLGVFGYWEREADDTWFLDSPVWNLEGN